MGESLWNLLDFVTSRSLSRKFQVGLAVLQALRIPHHVRNPILVPLPHFSEPWFNIGLDSLAPMASFWSYAGVLNGGFWIYGSWHWQRQQNYFLWLHPESVLPWGQLGDHLGPLDAAPLKSTVLSLASDSVPRASLMLEPALAAPEGDSNSEPANHCCLVSNIKTRDPVIARSCCSASSFLQISLIKNQQQWQKSISLLHRAKSLLLSSPFYWS